MHIVDSDQEYEDQEYEDQEYEDQDHEEEQDVENLSDVNFTRKKLNVFRKFWPSHFDSQSIESIHGLDRNSNSSIIRIQLGDWKDISHTWLQDLEQSDIYKDDYWLKEKLDKLSKFPYFPIFNKKQIFPKRLPVNFPTRKAEAYFSASQFAKSNAKLTVPSIIFGAESMKLPMSDNPLFEYWGRQGTLECQISNEMLLLELDITETISNLVNKLEISDNNVETIVELKDSLSLLNDANKLARQSNFRAKSYAITSSCKAKLNMRDALLKNVKGEEFIKNALRGSCFMDEDIFGPIAKNVQSKIDSFSNRSDSRLTPTSSFKKRTGDSLPRRGTKKRRGTVSRYNSQNSNFNYNGGSSGYDYGYNYPSSSNSVQNVSQAPQSHFQEKPRPKSSRGKTRRGRGSRN